MHRTSFATILLAALSFGPVLAQTPPAVETPPAAAPTTPPPAATAPSGMAPTTTTQPAASGDSIGLLEVTCAQARREGAPVAPRSITAALAGRLTVAAGHARLAPDYIQAISEALRRACPGNEANDRKLIDVAAGVAMPAKSAKDRDFATLTCTQLAPLWKEEARTIVPFLFALREGTAATPMTKAALDKIGGGLPKACAEPGNGPRKVLDVVKDLK